MSAREIRSMRRGGTMVYVLVAVLIAGATAGVMLLSQNIMERKIEAKQTTFKIVDISEQTIDPAILMGMAGAPNAATNPAMNPGAASVDETLMPPNPTGERGGQL